MFRELLLSCTSIHQAAFLNSQDEYSSYSYGYIRKVCILHWAESCSKVWVECLMAEDGAGWIMSRDDLQLNVLLNYI